MLGLKSVTRCRDEVYGKRNNDVYFVSYFHSLSMDSNPKKMKKLDDDIFCLELNMMEAFINRLQVIFKGESDEVNFVEREIKSISEKYRLYSYEYTPEEMMVWKKNSLIQLSKLFSGLTKPFSDKHALIYNQATNEYLGSLYYNLDENVEEFSKVTKLDFEDTLLVSGLVEFKNDNDCLRHLIHRCFNPYFCDFVNFPVHIKHLVIAMHDSYYDAKYESMCFKKVGESKEHMISYYMLTREDYEKSFYKL